MSKQDNTQTLKREEVIKKLVDRFLGWKLPENFSPDCGISFKRSYNEHTPCPSVHTPVGTNLFDAQQAKEMITYLLGDILDEEFDQLFHYNIDEVGEELASRCQCGMCKEAKTNNTKNEK